MSKPEISDAEFARAVAELVLDPAARVVLCKPGVVKLIVPHRLTSRRG